MKMNQEEFFRFYREDTGQTLGITSKFSQVQAEKICSEINNLELSAGKLLYEKASKTDYDNYRKNLYDFSYKP